MKRRVKLKTTLNANELRALNACEDGFEVFFNAHGEDTVTLTQALESNGWNDIWWYIAEIYRELSDEQKKDLRLLACDYAEDVLPIFEKLRPEDSRPRDAIEDSRKYANGEIDDAAWAAARDAAWAAARDAAWDAARDAAWDAARDAARDAAWDAARDAARAAAWAAARAAARAAAWDAAWAAAWAAWAAAEAAWAAWAAAEAAEAAARADKKEWQENKLKELFLKWEIEDEDGN